MPFPETLDYVDKINDYATKSEAHIALIYLIYDKQTQSINRATTFNSKLTICIIQNDKGGDYSRYPSQ